MPTLAGCSVQVNADVVHWQWKDGRWTVLKVLTKETGTAIYTKAVGFDSHHDITNQYKKREGILLHNHTTSLLCNIRPNITQRRKVEKVPSDAAYFIFTCFSSSPPS